MEAHEFMRRIGMVLRVKDDDFAHEPLPERWVDLIVTWMKRNGGKARERHRQRHQ